MGTPITTHPFRMRFSLLSLFSFFLSASASPAHISQVRKEIAVPNELASQMLGSNELRDSYTWREVAGGSYGTGKNEFTGNNIPLKMNSATKDAHGYDGPYEKTHGEVNRMGNESSESTAERMSWG